jgi:hypothetical protein
VVVRMHESCWKCQWRCHRRRMARNHFHRRVSGPKSILNEAESHTRTQAHMYETLHARIAAALIAKEICPRSGKGMTRSAVWNRIDGSV